MVLQNPLNSEIGIYFPDFELEMKKISLEWELMLALFRPIEFEIQSERPRNKCRFVYK